jgi:hypothetical protein
VDQAADCKMRHEQAVELLADEIGGLGAQNDLGAAQMGFELTKSRLDFPSLLVKCGQLLRWRLLGIEDGGGQTAIIPLM